jgi:NADPH:quinone reductase-like Zn-dependent oxidoreductase
MIRIPCLRPSPITTRVVTILFRAVVATIDRAEELSVRGVKDSPTNVQHDSCCAASLPTHIIWGDIRLGWMLRQVKRLLSYRIRRKAKRHRVSYSFLFMRADGDRLGEITSLIDSGIIRPVVDRIFPFESTKGPEVGWHGPGNLRA